MSLVSGLGPRSYLLQEWLLERAVEQVEQVGVGEEGREGPARQLQVRHRRRAVGIAWQAQGEREETGVSERAVEVSVGRAEH